MSLISLFIKVPKSKLPFLKSIKVAKCPKRETQLCCFGAHIGNEGSNIFSVPFPLYSNDSGPISFLNLQSIKVAKKVKKKSRSKTTLPNYFSSTPPGSLVVA